MIVPTAPSIISRRPTRVAMELSLCSVAIVPHAKIA
jgi:hypothetical protein